MVAWAGNPIRGVAWEDGGATCLARIVGLSGSNITQAVVSSIACTVYDVTGAVSIITPSITVSSVVFDTLQTDSRWDVDSTGFNFAHALPATAFPTYGHVYRVEYKFAPVSGAAYYVVFEVTAQRVYS